jgi:hypothetical protein
LVVGTSSTSELTATLFEPTTELYNKNIYRVGINLLKIVELTIVLARITY